MYTPLQIVKLEQQLAHKEEMGEVLNLVDFDQLKIENQQYMERIEEKNNELLQLKLSTSRTVQVLNSLKQQLHELSASGGALRGQIRDLEDNMSKLEAAGEEAEAQVGGRRRLVRKPVWPAGRQTRRLSACYVEGFAGRLCFIRCPLHS